MCQLVNGDRELVFVEKRGQTREYLAEMCNLVLDLAERPIIEIGAVDGGFEGCEFAGEGDAQLWIATVAERLAEAHDAAAGYVGGIGDLLGGHFDHTAGRRLNERGDS